MNKIPKPTIFSFPVLPPSVVRFAIEYTGNLSKIDNLQNFRNFISINNPKRVSFEVEKKTSFFEPLGLLKKEIRSNDPDADKFLKFFVSDNKYAKIKKIYFFREAGTAPTIIPNIEKPTKEFIQASENLKTFGILIGVIALAILATKDKKR